MSLRVAVTLRLPDRLLTRFATADQLATELDVSPIALELLLKHLATLGVVETTTTGYRTTDFGAHLSAEAGNGWTHNLLNLDRAGGRAEMAFVELAHSIATGKAAYPRRYGHDFYTDLDAHPHLRASFDLQMTQRFRDQLPDIVAGFDWARFPTIVDVGGGQGNLLAAILTANPHIHGHLIDLEPTATQAARTFGEHDLNDRARVSAASFFDPLPSGASAYVLFDILHNWDDEHAHHILSRCAHAATPNGRILIIEAAGRQHTNTEADLAMLAIFGGRDRRIGELRDLAAAHNLVLTTTTELTQQRRLLEFTVAAEATDTLSAHAPT